MEKGPGYRKHVLVGGLEILQADGTLSTLGGTGRNLVIRLLRVAARTGRLHDGGGDLHFTLLPVE